MMNLHIKMNEQSESLNESLRNKENVCMQILAIQHANM